MPVPDSPPLSAQVLSLPRSSMQHPAPGSLFDRNCAQPQAPEVGRTQNEKLTGDQLHEQCSQRGYRRKGPKDVSKTSLASMDAAEAKRVPLARDDTVTSENVNGERERAPAEGTMGPDRPPNRGRSSRGLCCGRGSSEGACPIAAF